MQAIKKSERDIIVLDAGDLLFSRRVHSSLSAPQQKEVVLGAQLIVDAFNLMGCDAVGIGLDELRLGTKTFAKATKKAAFPFISANLVRTSGRQISNPSVVKNVGGLRWGIFSLMSANPAAQAQTPDWKVLDPVSTAKQVVEKLRGKADIIILLAAMPLQELRALLSEVPGITIAVAGDNPSGLRNPLQVGGTIVVSSYGYGRYLGVLKLGIGDPEAPFVDEAKIMALERELAVLEGKIKVGAAGSFSELKQKIEAKLEELRQGNSYRTELIMLSSRFPEDRKVNELLKKFSAQAQELKKGCNGK